jgi:Ca2+-binding EF-hand superfamily protein
LEIAKQIKAAMIVAKIAYREAFNRFDSNGNGFISFSEFSQGIDKIMTLSLPVKEKFFSFMDKKHIGVVDYPTFLEVIQSSAVADIKRNNFTDSFDWENSIVDKIKEWIIGERITIEEAFKCFDKDFDGFIMKEDLRWALMNLLKVKEEEILPTKLDRLFRLLDFYKTGKI